MTTTFSNPIVPQRADPWVYLHTDGYYYFTASVPEYDRIELRRARAVGELGAAESRAIWHKHASGPMSQNIWAPEIHFADGVWTIYFAAGSDDAPFGHRTYALQTEAANPLEGDWSERGRIETGWDSFTLDATSFEHRGTRYFVWAQRDPAIDNNSNLYIAAMRDPLTLVLPAVLIAQPEYDWEIIGFKVNEGPAALITDAHVFISFSASATDHHYCMGLLVADVAADLLQADSWRKLPQPVFTTSEANGQYGPGHNSFTRSPDGAEHILVYHARPYKEIVGDPLFDPNRHARAQTFTFTPDGFPDFGVPVPDPPAA